MRQDVKSNRRQKAIAGRYTVLTEVMQETKPAWYGMIWSVSDLIGHVDEMRCHQSNFTVANLHYLCQHCASACSRMMFQWIVQLIIHVLKCLSFSVCLAHGDSWWAYKIGIWKHMQRYVYIDRESTEKVRGAIDGKGGKAKRFPRGIHIPSCRSARSLNPFLFRCFSVWLCIHQITDPRALLSPDLAPPSQIHYLLYSRCWWISAFLACVFM